MDFFSNNTGNTISVNYKPGEDFRDFPTQEQSIFTFGDYRITKSSLSGFVSGDTGSLMFNGYETLNSLNVADNSRRNNIFVSAKELNLDKKNPNSYAYFQNLKMEITKSIDNIVANWPYGIVSLSDGASATGYDYTAVTTGDSAVYSKIKIPFSAITNQGGVLLNSGSTITGRSLMTNTDEFIVQLGGSSYQDNEQHQIVEYIFSAGTYLEFTFNSILLTGQTSGETNLPILIRPNDKIIKRFFDETTSLEEHILKSGIWRIKDPEFDNEKYITKTYVWPKSIDGYNIDTFGQDFNNYIDDLVNLTGLIDEDKTDMMMRTMIPENFLDMDSENKIYRKVVQTYANEFDKLKRYIDNISFAHTVNYKGTNSVPDKFIIKLSELLGWKLTSGFSELDLFEYLATEVGEQKITKKEFDVELWRRILVNIIWLFKRKGTRDALQFIFKLIGAPDCMVRLEEFVYDINTAFIQTNSLLDIELNSKINENGYINYDASEFVFQEGGKGRGTGQKYIQQWTPEYDPIIRLDNVKTVTGNPAFFGSENIVNTKELIVGLDPAKAIECDSYQHFQLSGVCDTVGEETLLCSDVQPESMSSMTLVEWVDFVYKTNVDPKNRKVTNHHNGGYFYKDLRNIYINYYKIQSPESNKLTTQKLEGFLYLIEKQFYNSAEQLIPATSILQAFGTIYRNTVFNRQKFPYPAGINDGSEFQIGITNPKDCLKPVSIENEINDIVSANNNLVNVDSNIVTSINLNINPFVLEVGANLNSINNQIDGFNIEVEIEDFNTEEQIVEG